MARQPLKRKCLHCQAFFIPDPRCVERQRYCSELVCRKASKAASQRRWLDQPDNHDYFKGADHVERVRAWRQAHPGYWRRQNSQASSALQDESTPKPSLYQSVKSSFTQDALQDDLFRQPTVLVGLIAHLTGLALQDDIVNTTRGLQQLGRDILSGSRPPPGGVSDAQASPVNHQTATPAPTVQLGGSALGPRALYRPAQS